jgi:LysM repeat protein
MSVLAALGFLILTADVQMTLAPDQPLAYVYVDDPLIVELVSPEETTARVRLRIQGADRPDATEISLGDLQLPAHAPRWCAVKEAPHARGVYTVEATIEIRDTVQKKSARFCRVDRAAAHRPLPFYVTAGEDCDTRFLLALKSVGLTTLRIDAGREDFTARAKLAADLGLSVVAHVGQRAYAPVGALLAGLNGKGPVPVRWEVEYGGDRASFTGFVDTVLKSAGNAPMAVVVADRAALEKYFSECADAPVWQCVLSGRELAAPSEVAAVRMLALRHGHEGWKVNVLAQGGAPPEGVKGARGLVKRSMELLAAGASSIGVDAQAVYTGGELCDTAGYLNGMAVRLDSVEFAGSLPLADGVTSLLFRREGRWLAALWAGDETDVSIALDGVVNPELTDGLGNPAENSELRDSTLALKAGPAPMYLSGVGGVVPGKAAQKKAVEIAGNILANTELSSALPAPLRDLIKAIQGDVSGAASRGRFLELVGYLPKLEEQWHAGQMPLQTAVPAMSAIADLLRSLCLVEDDRGEPFLQPMSDTVARCEELQSLYLTGSPAHADERLRGEWLLREVRRLVDEAEALERGGRRVEASAVATLAKGRAEGLPFAARAASAPTVSPAPAPEPEPVPEPAKPDPKKPAKDEKTGKDTQKGDEKKPAPAETEKPADKKVGEKDAPAAAEPAARNGEVKEVVHIVASGDNPSIIAGKYNVKLEELLAYNKMKKSVRLNIGDKVVVPVKEGQAKPADKPSGKSTKKKRRR